MKTMKRKGEEKNLPMTKLHVRVFYTSFNYFWKNLIKKEE